MSEPLTQRAARRLRREGRLFGKSVRQHLSRLAGGAGPKRTIFVSGLQRSGTNMLMDAFERGHDTQVFHESDPRAFDNYRQRDAAVIRRLIDRSPAPVVVVKGLLEAHRVRGLLDDFAPAKAIWVFRHFDDQINSNMVNWVGGRNQIDDIVVDRNSADWRGLGMTDATHELIKRHYVTGMNDASALALFFYYRHQLFYDQALDRDPRVYLLNYEDLVTAPARTMSAVARFCGIADMPQLTAHIHAKSIRRATSPDISADTRALAESMFERLQATRRANHGDDTAG